MPDAATRTTHAAFPGAGAIVRYDSTAEWYYEPESGEPRVMKVDEAVSVAYALHSVDPERFLFYPGTAGGRSFDVRLREALGDALVARL